MKNLPDSEVTENFPLFFPRNFTALFFCQNSLKTSSKLHLHFTKIFLQFTPNFPSIFSKYFLLFHPNFSKIPSKCYLILYKCYSNYCSQILFQIYPIFAVYCFKSYQILLNIFHIFPKALQNYFPNFMKLRISLKFP